MKRKGQVALYLVLVITAITFLILMNVGSFIAVSARNTTMNGGDAAALAVARYQGELLNRIGQWNLDHLEAALKGDAAECEEIVLKQLRCSFLDPIEGIRIGNEAAKNNDCDENGRMQKILADHANDIRQFYAPNEELYPAPWKDAWEDYAQAIELAISGGIWAGPDNVDFIDSATGHMLLNQGFYAAIAGRNWCWFHFNAPGLLDSYSGFRDWEPLPGADLETRRRRAVNSEIYSLHLDLRVGSAIELLGTNLVMRLTGATADELDDAPLLNDRSQKWFFFDQSESWRVWWEIDPTGEWAFPAMGRVKPEYDVRGCAAVCRTSRGFQNVVEENERESVWSAAAKPFGAVINEDGETDVVTALRGFVTPNFTDARLVALDTVGGQDLSTADPEWMEHVMHHLDGYFKSGPNRLSSCWYCQQLVAWEKPTLRAEGSRWLKYHSSDCIRPGGPGGGHGGSAHGH